MIALVFDDRTNLIALRRNVRERALAKGDP